MAQKEIIHFPGPFLFALCCVTGLGRLRSPPALASHSAVDLASYFTGNMEITRKGLPRAWPPALGLRHSARSPVTADELPVLRRPPWGPCTSAPSVSLSSSQSLLRCCPSDRSSPAKAACLSSCLFPIFLRSSPNRLVSCMFRFSSLSAPPPHVHSIWAGVFVLFIALRKVHGKKTSRKAFEVRE